MNEYQQSLSDLSKAITADLKLESGQYREIPIMLSLPNPDLLHNMTPSEVASVSSAEELNPSQQSPGIFLIASAIFGLLVSCMTALIINFIQTI